MSMFSVELFSEAVCYGSTQNQIQMAEHCDLCVCVCRLRDASVSCWENINELSVNSQTYRAAEAAAGSAQTLAFFFL